MWFLKKQESKNPFLEPKERFCNYCKIKINVSYIQPSVCESCDSLSRLSGSRPYYLKDSEVDEWEDVRLAANFCFRNTDDVQQFIIDRDIVLVRRKEIIELQQLKYKKELEKEDRKAKNIINSWRVHP